VRWRGKERDVLERYRYRWWKETKLDRGNRIELYIREEGKG